MLIEETYSCSKQDSYSDEMEIIKKWMLNVIGEPCEEIKRHGAICPFVKRAHNSGSIYMVEYDAKDVEYDKYIDHIYRFSNFYNKKEKLLPNDKKDLFSIVIIIKNLSEDKYNKFIDAVHYTSRLHFMKKALMIGEFHPHSQKPSVRNNDFCPLVSPIPCFVIRKLTTHDILFINQEGDQIEKRKAELRLYVEKNGITGEKAHNFLEKRIKIY
ncbi:DUF6875 domain-containing protein [Xenorhabdus griffiniae]|uniref:DUF6875 domain-containing protein n=1 Tax=Xenorhabdus griffiniae TaxID=351672 RepID=UPI002358BD29|nr:hypothetical protein [Xenorhabdus griffiniae]MDC9605748.1 hypothetical protein [Xenorhabdus griffiniae]